MKTFIENIRRINREESTFRESGLKKFRVTTNNLLQPPKTVWLKEPSLYRVGSEFAHKVEGRNNAGESYTAFFENKSRTGRYVLVKEVLAS